jgi:hypothetical protein
MQGDRSDIFSDEFREARSRSKASRATNDAKRGRLVLTRLTGFKVPQLGP